MSSKLKNKDFENNLMSRSKSGKIKKNISRSAMMDIWVLTVNILTTHYLEKNYRSHNGTLENIGYMFLKSRTNENKNEFKNKSR